MLAKNKLKIVKVTKILQRNVLLSLYKIQNLIYTKSGDKQWE